MKNFKFTLCGIPIYGELTSRHISAITKIARITSKQLWKGVKGIYVTNNKHYQTLWAGMYVRLDSTNKNSFATIQVEDSVGIKNSYKVKPRQAPFIWSHGGLIDDEYWFAINIMHELSHHVNYDKQQEMSHEDREVNAHHFAMDYVKESMFKRESDVELTYWNEALKRYKQEK